MNTTFGLMPANTSLIEKENILKETGINLVRQPLFIKQVGTDSEWITQLLQKGFQVAVNLDWSNTSSPVPFPTNAALIQQAAENFFSYYEGYLGQMPFVVCENEWNNPNFHTGKSLQSAIQDYLNELAIVTNVAHKYGFKVADAGISGTGLQYWAYSRLAGDAKRQYAKDYNVPYGSANYILLKQAVVQYGQGIKNIPIDYLNVHWYETDTCFNWFETAAKLYQKFCNKPKIITNELGIRGKYSDTLLQQTINSVKGNVDYAVLYSGNNALSISNQDIKTYLK